MFKSTEITRGVEDVNIFFPLVKVDAVKKEVWGVVTAETPDRDNEVCDYESTVPHYKALVEEMSKATDGKNIFPLRVMHGLVAAGKGISIDFRDEQKQIYMGFKVVDDNEWKKVEEGVYTGFSQGGKYIKRWKDGDLTRYTAKPVECSLVDIPCLPDAHFDYIKLDGTVEVRKFVKSNAPEQIPSESGKINSEIQQPTNVAPPCTCSCPNCKGGNCGACAGETKCSSAKASKAVKYLVNVSGEKHLPYTDESGKPNHRLMGAAWAALHGGYRGNKYQGPNKQAAIRRLKQVYAQEGMDTPSEKAAVIGEFLNTALVDAINNRAYGMLNKGLYTVARFASILEDLKFLHLAMDMERDQEGDDSPVTDDVREAYMSLLNNLLAYTEEQVEEEHAGFKIA